MAVDTLLLGNKSKNWILIHVRFFWTLIAFMPKGWWAGRWELKAPVYYYVGGATNLVYEQWSGQIGIHWISCLLFKTSYFCAKESLIRKVGIKGPSSPSGASSSVECVYSGALGGRRRVCRRRRARRASVLLRPPDHQDVVKFLTEFFSSTTCPSVENMLWDNFSSRAVNCWHIKNTCEASRCRGWSRWGSLWGRPRRTRPAPPPPPSSTGSHNAGRRWPGSKRSVPMMNYTSCVRCVFPGKWRLSVTNVSDVSTLTGHVTDGDDQILQGLSLTFTPQFCTIFYNSRPAKKTWS